ncbi:hypothetical protein M885DRAFT_512397 [Pelagophyceae sp. CCMP2097]|nr:hypothetical protein M885DRAFT_512397 [Pelagophyceae sp. CCMP2097]
MVGGEEEKCAGLEKKPASRGWALARRQRLAAAVESKPRGLESKQQRGLERRPSGQVQLHGDRVERLRSCAVADRSLVRGLRVARLLDWQTFANTDLAASDLSAEAEALYGMSEAAPRLHYFVSHSWRASRLHKWLSLCVEMNGTVAARVSCGVALVFALFRRQQLLPACGSYVDEDLGRRLEFGIPYALISGLVATGACLFAGHLLPWRASSAKFAFVDKYCVHQSDPYRKRAAIDHFSGFIAESDELLVLWSPGYFDRLWCTFEIASFLYIKEELRLPATLNILPLVINEIAIAAFLCNFTYCAAVAVLLSTGVWDSSERVFGQVAGEGAVLLALAGPPLTIFANAARRYAKDRSEALVALANFSANEASVFDEADRAVVSAVINTWYPVDGISHFNNKVRTTVRDTVAAALGIAVARQDADALAPWRRWRSWFAARRPLPYKRALLCTLPAFWLGLDYMASMRSAPAVLQLALGLTTLVAAPFFALPSLGFCIFFAAAKFQPAQKVAPMSTPRQPAPRQPAPDAPSRIPRPHLPSPAYARPTLLVDFALGLAFTVAAVLVGSSLSTTAYIAMPYGAIAATLGWALIANIVWGDDENDQAPFDGIRRGMTNWPSLRGPPPDHFAHEAAQP